MESLTITTKLILVQDGALSLLDDICDPDTPYRDTTSFGLEVDFIPKRLV